ncbi:hypothetical protein AB0D08_11810 [Kitasatospora sp. NPDC048540]|uniref:hypothetical protein n=1 Tax=Kitasatospora sp. NPDC048540 TaxID=3155634 RepID=UPI0033FE8F7D
MTWIIEGFRRGQDELTAWYRLPESFSVETAAAWVGDWPDLVGSVFDVPEERIPEMAALLGIEADPDVDYCLSDRDLG